MKRFSMIFIAASLATGALAQSLDTVSIVDQFNEGTSRGQDKGSVGSAGGVVLDGTEFLAYSGPDATISDSSAINYINSWGTTVADPESPIYDITQANPNPDRLTFSLPPIMPNTRPGASDGSTAVVIGDDGGFNALFFGESLDADYFVSVDMFCPVSTVGTGFEQAGLAVRAGRDTADQTAPRSEGTYAPDTDGSYVLFYNYQDNEIQAGTFANKGGTGSGLPRQFTAIGAPVEITADGWHTLTIECDGENITFKLDGTVIATTTDTTINHGRPCLYYREITNVAPELERQGTFDHLRAGPVGTANVVDWNIYN